jgi:hypothetical protein
VDAERAAFVGLIATVPHALEAGAFDALSALAQFGDVAAQSLVAEAAMSGRARIVLDPAAADGVSTLSLDNLRTRWRADVVAELDAELDTLGAELGLPGKLRAEMMARALALIGPRFELVCARLVGKGPAKAGPFCIGA